MYVIRGYIIAQYFLRAATPRMFEKPPSFLFKVKINEDNVNISIHGKMEIWECSHSFQRDNFRALPTHQSK